MTTGEIIEQTREFIDVGSRILSPAQLEAIRKKNEAESNKKLNRASRTELGRDYFFIDRIHDFGSLKNQTLARLIFLATYLPGGSKLGDNQLYKTRLKPLRTQHLLEILNLKSRSARDSFLKDAKSYITVAEDGAIFLNKDVFIRGHLPKKYKELQRASVSNIRQVFRSIPPSKHRLLGLVFKGIPYLNLEYNILCEDPDETELNAVQPLSEKQFCTITGYDYGEIYRLRQELEQIVFPVGDHFERFCSIFPSGNSANINGIFVNPHIMYFGSNFSLAEFMGDFRVME